MQVFIVSSKKIQERNYETLFRWLTQSNKINFIGRVVLSVPPMWQVLPADSPLAVQGTGQKMPMTAWASSGATGRLACSVTLSC